MQLKSQGRASMSHQKLPTGCSQGALSHASTAEVLIFRNVVSCRWEINGRRRRFLWFSHVNVDLTAKLCLSWYCMSCTGSNTLQHTANRMPSIQHLLYSCTSPAGAVHETSEEQQQLGTRHVFDTMQPKLFTQTHEEWMMEITTCTHPQTVQTRVKDKVVVLLSMEQMTVVFSCKAKLSTL